jgi:hypothetical protein
VGDDGITGHQGAGADEVVLGRSDGERKYKVVEQGLGRLERRIRAILKVFEESGGDSESAASNVDAGTLHDALVAFIPSLMPLHEFRGLKSADALKKLEDEGPDSLTEADYIDTDPSIPQLMDAIEAIYQVNGGDRLIRFLGKFVEPEMLRARIRYELQNRGVDRQPKTAGTTPSPDSPSLPQQNGGSARTPSGMSDPDPSQTVPSA